MLIAHISDPHISLERPPKQEALRRVVAHLLSLPLRPDAVVLTGDCTDHGTPAEYARLRELLGPLPMPVYVVPGNHDQRQNLLAAFGEQGTHALPGFVQYAAQVGPLRLLALDTHVPGQNGGLLDPPRLNWLAERLNEAPGRPTLIFMHRPPLVSGLQVMDSIGLEGTERLRDVLAQHPQVRRLLAGHTHMAQTQAFGGTLLMVCPGTDFGFLPDLTQPERLAVQMQPALCLLHHLTPQGEVLIRDWALLRTSEKSARMCFAPPSPVFSSAHSVRKNSLDTQTIFRSHMTYSSVVGQYPLTTLHDGEAWQ